MKGAFTVIILLFEILGLIITVVERQDKIKHGFIKSRRYVKQFIRHRRNRP